MVGRIWKGRTRLHICERSNVTGRYIDAVLDTYDCFFMGAVWIWFHFNAIKSSSVLGEFLENENIRRLDSPERYAYLNPTLHVWYARERRNATRNIHPRIIQI